MFLINQFEASKDSSIIKFQTLMQLIINHESISHSNAQSSGIALYPVEDFIAIRLINQTLFNSYRIEHTIRTRGKFSVTNGANVKSFVTPTVLSRLIYLSSINKDEPRYQEVLKIFNKNELPDDYYSRLISILESTIDSIFQGTVDQVEESIEEKCARAFERSRNLRRANGNES